jgi:hypothetical protein
MAPLFVKLIVFVEFGRKAYSFFDVYRIFTLRASKRTGAWQNQRFLITARFANRIRDSCSVCGQGKGVVHFMATRPLRLEISSGCTPFRTKYEKEHTQRQFLTSAEQ